MSSWGSYIDQLVSGVDGGQAAVYTVGGQRMAISKDFKLTDSQAEAIQHFIDYPSDKKTVTVHNVQYNITSKTQESINATSSNGHSCLAHVSSKLYVIVTGPQSSVPVIQQNIKKMIQQLRQIGY